MWSLLVRYSLTALYHVVRWHVYYMRVTDDYILHALTDVRESSLSTSSIVYDHVWYSSSE